MWFVLLTALVASAATVDVPCCGPNAHYETCPSQCVPRNCSDIWTDVECDSTDVCEPGCTCNEKYLIDDDTGECVSIYTCQDKPGRPCGSTEKAVDDKITCPPQDCEAQYLDYLCAFKDPHEKTPGCDCRDGYLRNVYGVCVPTTDCPPGPWRIHPFTDSNSTASEPLSCGPNEKVYPCKNACPPQNCDISYTSYPPCDYTVDCVPGCDCTDGYLRSSTGVCVLTDDCQKYVCKANETYSTCNFRCPNRYCPEDDDLIKIACKPPRDCPPGCVCETNYRYRSYDDETCVLASDCPPVNCTRPNEEWDPCPCTADSCDPDYCEPQCVCSKGFIRDATKYCINPQEK